MQKHMHNAFNEIKRIKMKSNTELAMKTPEANIQKT